jgi:hypothetical protein
MDSFEPVDQRELLSTVTLAYLEIFRPYRGQHGVLDSNLWFKKLEVDYALEVILANFAFVNLTCERILEETTTSQDSEEDSQGEIMADYDMGYLLAEDCTEITRFAKQEEIDVRLSLCLELFYAHIQYFNISNTGGRHEWFDVNKRLLGSMVRLIQLEPKLMDLLDEWALDVEDLEPEDLEDVSTPVQVKWKKEFIDEIYENISNSESSKF